MGRIFIKEGFPISVFIKEDDSKETTMWVLKYNLENDERAVLLCALFSRQKEGCFMGVARVVSEGGKRVGKGEGKQRFRGMEKVMKIPRNFEK